MARPRARARHLTPAPSNVDVVAAIVRDAIVRGRLAPGERIKEIPLAHELGVSRGPIRDALRLLERDGLVELVPNRGALVPAVEAQDVLEVYALRAALGSLALHKLLLDGDVPRRRSRRSSTAFRRAVDRGRVGQAFEADLGYQTAIVARRAADAERLWREKFERWVRALVDLLPDEFDDALWVALTAS